jgi:hypothetical protein
MIFAYVLRESPKVQFTMLPRIRDYYAVWRGGRPVTQWQEAVYQKNVDLLKIWNTPTLPSQTWN